MFFRFSKTNKYDEVVLWFGPDLFCEENKKVILKALEDFEYKGNLVINIVNEETGDIIEKIYLYY